MISRGIGLKEKISQCVNSCGMGEKWAINEGCKRIKIEIELPYLQKSSNPKV